MDELRAELDQVIVPKVNADIARFLRLHAADPPSERAQLQRIPASWKAAALTEGGALESVGESLSAGQRNQVADAIADAMDPLILSVSARQPIERNAASEAHAGAQATYNRDRACRMPGRSSSCATTAPTAWKQGHRWWTSTRCASL